MKLVKRVLVAMLLGIMAIQVALADMDKKIEKLRQDVQMGRNLIDSISIGDIKAVKYYISKGANVNANIILSDNRSITTPLLSAVRIQGISEYRKKEIVEYLISKGANVNGSVLRVTALHLAIKNGEKEIVELLIDKGADVNARDIHGRTALMYAAGGDDLEIVKYLVSKGADVNAKDNQGKSVFDRADTLDRNDEIFEFLLSSGAKCDDCDE